VLLMGGGDRHGLGDVLPGHPQRSPDLSRAYIAQLDDTHWGWRAHEGQKWEPLPGWYYLAASERQKLKIRLDDN
jgi:hypothetical protein